MKTLVKMVLPALALVLGAAAMQPAEARTCVKLRDISGTDSKDGKTLTFRMRDGTVMNNHLRQQCNDLRFGGFTWEVKGDENICEDAQILRVNHSGMLCSLGKFDAPVKPAPRR